MNALNKFTKNNITIETFPVGPLGVNCSVIYDERTYEAWVIDPGQDESLLYYNDHGNNLKFNCLLHTHAHFDHIGVTPTLKKKSAASIFIFEDELPIYNTLPTQGQLFNLVIQPPPAPDALMKHNQMISFASEEGTIKNFFKVLHSPGHTIGSCCFFTDFFDIPILFSGDTLFRESIGRTDLPTGNYEQIKTSITEELFKLPENTHVIPGHGPCTTIGHEKKFNAFFGDHSPL